MILSLLASAILSAPQAQTTLTVDLTKPGVAVSPNLYGLMTEEINHSYDGGLYGELLGNRSLKDDPAVLNWEGAGAGSTIVVDRRGGMSDVMPVALKVHGAVANQGFWGIPVRPSTTYHLTVWAKGAHSLEASLESVDGSTTYAHASVLDMSSPVWLKYTVDLNTSAGIMPTKDARLVLRPTGGDFQLSMASLMGPTYNNRPNGSRPDLMQLLVDMKPQFLRFPGGNYLEGNIFRERFNWKATLGPIESRPGHLAPWSYRSYDGMGLLEFLEWCEDMKAKPLLAVFAGYTLSRDYVGSGTELEGFVKDALDEIEYVTGNTNTKWGAQRAKDGHPKPFPLECVEVGNEDGFDGSGSYEGRFVQFYDAIKKKYPHLQVISTTGGKDSIGQRFKITKRRPDIIDEHYYDSTWQMMAFASKYDSYDRKGPKIFIGEWAAQDVPAPWIDAQHKGPTPNMNCAIADAAFMTGMERNSDLVVMACYAPLLVNVNPGGRQWAVNLIGYDALDSFGSPSYYAQKMFMANVGDHTVPTVLAGAPIQTQGNQTLPGIFVSTTRDTKSGTVYLKVVNALPTDEPVSVVLNGAKSVKGAVLTSINGDPKLMNTLAEPKRVAPITITLGDVGTTFKQTFAAHSVNVIKVVIQ